MPESASLRTFEPSPSLPRKQSLIACLGPLARHARQTQSLILAPQCPAFHKPGLPGTTTSAALAAQTELFPPECRRKTLLVVMEISVHQENAGIFFQATARRQIRIAPRRLSRRRSSPFPARGPARSAPVFSRSDSQPRDGPRLRLPRPRLAVPE